MLDALDFQIIERFHKIKVNEEKTLTEIIRQVLDIKGKVGNKEYNFIWKRLVRMSNLGLFKIGRNCSTHFILDSDKVFKARFSFPTRRSSAIAVLIDGKYQVFEL